MIEHPVRAIVAFLLVCSAVATARTPAPIVDPLTARIDDSAVRRFAALWNASGGKPTAARLQEGYLANGGRAIEVFTPDRIVSAGRLANTIAANPDIYRDAVDRCLPWVAGTNAQLRSAYLGLKGLLPNRQLPSIAVVMGANNSGGTADKGIQVIGLEVICRLSPTQAEFEEQMRSFFAHETVHTLQEQVTAPDSRTMLLATALNEGVADYVTSLVTGAVPDAARDRWARSREDWIWRHFVADSAIISADTDEKGELGQRGQAAFNRWLGNAGNAPQGWPGELGYWVGMRIAEAYVAASADPHAAIDELLKAADPTAILIKSRYGTATAH